MVSPPYAKKRHNAAEGNLHVLVIRYSYRLLFSLSKLAITTVTIGLFASRVWCQALAGIRRRYSGGVPPTTRSSPTTGLPMEVIEMIVAYLIYEKPSLIACSLTCRSWYIAVVPHLHHTFIAPIGHLFQRQEYMWPRPLLCKHKLGLLPLVKIFWICSSHSYHPEFSPKLLDCDTLSPFFSLTNVRQLWIDHLDIPSFVPKIQRYFIYFVPTLRRLVLKEPKGSDRQIVYFIGLFQHLEDLELIHDGTRVQEEPADDLTLIPPFIPPLRGCLMVTSFTRVGFFKDMIDLFGGIRFRYMGLLGVNEMRLLLDACGKSLEVVALCPNDLHG